MNIVAGQSSGKIHLSNGSMTMCHKKSFNKLNESEFIADFKKYPEICCKQCVYKLRITGKIV